MTSNDIKIYGNITNRLPQFLNILNGFFDFIFVHVVHPKRRFTFFNLWNITFTTINLNSSKYSYMTQYGLLFLYNTIIKPELSQA